MLVQKVPSHLHRVLGSVPKCSRDTVYRCPPWRARRVMQNTAFGPVRRISVGDTQALYQGVIVILVCIQWCLSVVVKQNPFGLFLHFPGLHVFPVLLGQFRDRTLSNDESVRGFHCETTQLSRVSPQRGGQLHPAIRRNPSLCLVKNRAHRRATLDRARRSTNRINTATRRQSHERLHRIQVVILRHRPRKHL